MNKLFFIFLVIATSSSYSMKNTKTTPKINVVVFLENNKIKVKITASSKTNNKISPTEIEAFHRAIEDMKRYQNGSITQFNKNPELALKARSFTHDTPLMTLLKTIIRYNIDGETITNYAKLASSLIDFNILVNRINPLLADSSLEITAQIEGILGLNHSLLPLFYQMVEWNITTEKKYKFKVNLEKFRVTPEFFFESFSESKQKKLLQFLATYPLWIQKIDLNGNTTLHSAFKNFSNVTEDFDLITFLLLRSPECILQQNNHGDDCFNIISEFSEIPRENLLYAVRSTISSIELNNNLTDSFLKNLSNGNYKLAKKLLIKNPSLCFVKIENKPLNSYIKNIKIQKNNQATDFKNIEKIIYLFLTQEQKKDKKNSLSLKRLSQIFVTKKKPCDEVIIVRSNTDLSSVHKEYKEYQEKTFKQDFEFGTSLNRKSAYSTKKE